MKRSKGEPPKNVPASVKGRLLALARHQNEEFNAILDRYVLERFLHRLATSAHATSFVLKGATLFAVWCGKPHRATRGIDLLGHGNPTGLQSEFSESTAKVAQWNAFVRRTRLVVDAPSLQLAATTVGALALPVLHELAAGRPFTGTWPAGGSW